MAETIKGITIQIGADTTALTKALGDVNKRSRDIQSELKQVDQLLKMDPTNVELLAQKQKLLGDAVTNTTEKLERLKNAQQQVNDQFARGEINEGQYRAYQREIAKTEQELRKYEAAIESASAETGKMAEKAKRDFKQVGDTVTGIGGKLSAGLTTPIAGIAALAVEGTRELRQDLAKLQTNAEQAGSSMEITSAAMRDLNAITGETDSNVEALSNLMQAGFTNDNLTKAVDALSGAVIKFPDTLKIEGVSDGLQETLATGAAIGPFAELLERMGVNLDDFNAGLTEATAAGQQQNYVLQQLAKLGLADVNAAYRENNKELVENANAQWDLQTALAEVGAMIEPILTSIISKVAEVLRWFNGLGDGTKKMILTIAGIAAAIGPILVIVGQLIASISALAPVIAALTGPIGLIVAAIAGLTAGLVILYNKNEEFRSFIDETWSAIKDTFVAAWEEILAFIMPLIEEMKSLFFDSLNQIKEFWESHGKLIMAFIEPWLTGLIGYFKIQFEAIKMVIDIAWTLIKAIIKTAFEYIKLVISNGLDIIKGLFDVFAALLKGDWQGAWNAIKDTSKNIMDNIIDFFKAIDLVQVGKDIIGGLIKGMGSMVGAAADSVKEVAGKIVGGIKGALKINSPSKVTEQLGEWTGEGLAIGIKRTQQLVSAQAQALSAAAIPDMPQASAAGAGSTMSGGVTISFAGATINVLSEEDITKFSQRIGAVVSQTTRSLGGA